jgi:hypothetical protein
MNLIQVDAFNAQSPQGVLALVAQGSRLQVAERRSILRIDAHAALREYQRALSIPQLAKRLANEALRMPVAIDGRRIDPGDAQFDRSKDCGAGVVIALITPTGPAECPRAKPERTQRRTVA